MPMQPSPTGATSGPFVPNCLFIIKVFCWNKGPNDRREGAGQNTLVPGQILNEYGYALACYFLEQAREILGIVKAQIVGQLLDRALGIIKASLCFQYQSVGDKFFGRETGVVLHDAVQAVGVERDLLSDVAYRCMIGKIVFYKKFEAD